ncbi:MAG: hypothetical protein FJ260_04805 [Planctomycetes bacterium]|nr:hypothetical protein [Planctomycetota bacterium]
MSARRGWASAACGVLLAAALHGPARAEGRSLPVAADAGHAWFVAERARAAGMEHVLLHHASAMGCDCVREALVLPAAPEAMAATGSDVWLVMPAGSVGRRDVLRVTSARNPATGAWFAPAPPSVLPSLPGDGALRGIAPVADGLLALRDGAGLELLSAGRWQPLAGAPDDAGCVLVPFAGGPALVDEAGAIRMRSPDGQWTALDVGAAGAGRLGFVPGAVRPTAEIRVDGGARSVRALVRGASLEVARYDPPERASGLVAIGDGLVLVLPTGEGGAAFRRFDPVTGAPGAPSVLEPQPADATRWVCLPSLAMLALATTVFVAMRRNMRLKSGSAERR